MVLSLEKRMFSYWESKDTAILADPATLALEDGLYRSFDWLGTLGPTLRENAPAIVSACMIATMSWYRISAQPGFDLRQLKDRGGRDATDVVRATVLFKLVNRVLPERVPDYLKPAYPKHPPMYSERDMFGMVNMSLELLHEHERTGSVEALDDALLLVYYALLLGSEYDSIAVEAGNQLGAILNRKYEHSTDEAFLESAKIVLFRAVDKAAGDGPRLQRVLTNLGHTLIRSSKCSGNGDELLLAVDALRKAVAIAPDDRAEHAAASLTNLSTALVKCFHRFRSAAALDEALIAIARAVDATPSGDRDLSNRLSNLSSVLTTRRGHLSDPTGHEEALVACRRAMHRATGPNRWSAMITLAHVLLDGGPDDVREALEVSRAAIGEIAPHQYKHYHAVLVHASALQAAGASPTEVVDLLARAEATVPGGHPDRPDVLGALGEALLRRGHDGDRERAVPCFLEVSKTPSASPLDRALAAGRAAMSQVELAEHEVATGTFGEALGLLESAVERGLDAEGDERLLASAPLLVNAAASCALDAGRPERAVELLEQGRGILLARAVGVAAVPEFDVLKQAAAGGPVVLVNVDGRRADALVVRESGVRVVRLPELTLSDLGDRVIAYALALQDVDAEDVAEQLKARSVVNGTLAWLWTAIVRPVLEVVDEPRVWWCPTSMLALFPLHAAGVYGADPVSALDRVVSSYTPTLRALLHTRSRPTRPATPFLVVAMSETPGHPDLPNAAVEARALAGRFPDHVLLADGEATRAAVAEALGRYSRAHVVCHGVQDIGSASAGGLVVHDGVLTVRDVLARQSSPGDVAFLAACVTAQSTLHLPNEVMTFAGALQMSSFQHVIGTVGPVDVTATEFADAFYAGESHLDDTAHRVHAVVQELRKRLPFAPILWATYVHFGP